MPTITELYQNVQHLSYHYIFLMAHQTLCHFATTVAAKKCVAKHAGLSTEFLVDELLWSGGRPVQNECVFLCGFGAEPMCEWGLKISKAYGLLKSV